MKQCRMTVWARYGGTSKVFDPAGWESQLPAVAGCISLRQDRFRTEQSLATAQRNVHFDSSRETSGLGHIPEDVWNFILITTL